MFSSWLVTPISYSPHLKCGVMQGCEPSPTQPSTVRQREDSKTGALGSPTHQAGSPFHGRPDGDAMKSQQGVQRICTCDTKMFPVISWFYLPIRQHIWYLKWIPYYIAIQSWCVLQTEHIQPAPKVMAQNMPHHHCRCKTGHPLKIWFKSACVAGAEAVV